MDNIGNKQFHVMCQIWGVDQAIKAAARMDMAPSKEQIETERQKEMEQNKTWDRAFRPEPKENKPKKRTKDMVCNNDYCELE